MKYVLSIGLIVFSLLFADYSYAQSGWEAGYVISNDGDTLRGFVDYRNWFSTPDHIRFRKQATDDVKDYSLKEIRQFQVHGEKYMKSSVLLYNDENELASEAPKIRADTVFLLQVFSGAKNLFSYKSKTGRLYFFVDQGQRYDLLTYYRYTRVRDGRSDIVTIDTYKQQLDAYFSDCPDLKNKTNRLTYSDKSIAKLYEMYGSSCGSQQVVNHVKRDKKLVQLGLTAGITMTKLEFIGNGTPGYLNTDFPTSVNFSGGGNLNIIIPRTKSRVSFFNDLLFTTYKVNATKDIAVSDNLRRWYEMDLGFSYVKLASMARYTFPAGGTKLFFNGGISNAFVIADTNEMTSRTTLNGNAGTTETRPVMAEYRKYEQGFVFGAGVWLKKWTAELRYERANGMSDIVTMNSRVQRGYLLVSYQF